MADPDDLVATSGDAALLRVPSGDGILVARAQRGDRKAFGELYAAHRATVRAALMSWVPPADANDLLQDVFEVALRRLPTLRDGQAFAAWLIGIARHRAVDFWRQRGRVFDSEPEPASADPPRSEAEQVLAAIRRLPEAYRETLVLRLVEGMNGAEIATRTGLTPGSVRVNLHRGMKLLRSTLGEEKAR